MSSNTSPISRRPVQVLAGVAGAWLALAGCSTRSAIPAGDSDVLIQASTTPTSAVKYIEITVHQLSDGALVYDSGLQPSSDFQDTRQYLERTAALAGSTDFLFDASAFDVNKALLKVGNTVQEATQPAGHSTTILIVIDLNSGGTNPTTPVDITAVTDNIPILYPPTMTGSDGSFTLHYRATDADQDTDAGPIDSNETLTYFSAILAGNVDLSGNGSPGLFTEGQDFSFTFNDGQPVKILSAVVDRLNQLTYAITVIDPTSGAFQTVEMGEGYALFDGNISLPPTRRVHARRADDPTGPHNGPIAVAVLKHGKPSAAGAGGYSVEAISRSDDSLVVTPANVAYWNDSVVASFNRYEEQPDAGGNIVVDYKLRVAFAPPPGATVTSPNPNAPLIVDTIKMADDGAGHFVFQIEAQEAATITLPSISSVSGGNAAGQTVTVQGSFFTGAYDAATASDPAQANDQRQVYLTMSGTYAYPASVNLVNDGEVDFVLPDGMAGGAWDVTVCSYGRLCVTAPMGLNVTNADFIYSEARDINNAGLIVGFAQNNAGNAYHALLWTDLGMPPTVLAPPDAMHKNGLATAINSSGFIVGYETSASSEIAVLWDNSAAHQPIELTVPGNAMYAEADDINDSNDVVGETADGSGNAIFVFWSFAGGAYAAQSLAAPAGGGGGIIAINNNDQIVGSVYFDMGNQIHAYVWTDPSAQAMALPESGAGFSQAFKINDQGTIAGRLFINNVWQPVVWTQVAGTQTWNDPLLLPVPSNAATDVTPVAIDAAGNIGGTYDDTAGNSVNFLWVVDPTGGYTLQLGPEQVGQYIYGRGMNDSDVMVGGFNYTDGNDPNEHAGEWDLSALAADQCASPPPVVCTPTQLKKSFGTFNSPTAAIEDPALNFIIIAHNQPPFGVTAVRADTLDVAWENDTAVSGPSALALGPDGYLYVGDNFNNQIAKLDPINGNLVTLQPIGKFDGFGVVALGMAFAPDGSLWVGNGTYNVQKGGNIVNLALDGSGTWQVVTGIETHAQNGNWEVAVVPERNRVYVASYDSSSNPGIAVINLDTSALLEVVDSHIDGRSLVYQNGYVYESGVGYSAYDLYRACDLETGTAMHTSAGMSISGEYLSQMANGDFLVVSSQTGEVDEYGCP